MISGTVTTILVLVIIISFVFALTNGLHDASSVVATFIACGAASPTGAIVLASVFGLLGAVFGGTTVADTMSSVIDLPTSAGLLPVILSAVIGATAWNLITWRYGLPSSSTHALVGGIIGAVIVSSGAGHVLWGWHALVSAGKLTGIMKILLSLLLSPLIGFVLAYLFGKITKFALRNAPFTANRPVMGVQWVLAAGLSFSHGANDMEKILGLIVMAIAAAGGAALHTAPLWTRILSGAVMSAGTMLGGWSIMKTIGRGIYEIKPIDSLNSQLASVAALFGANLTGAPVSTTHIVVGSVMGVGASDNYRMVGWRVANEIIAAWFITIPAAAAVSALCCFLIQELVKIV